MADVIDAIDLAAYLEPLEVAGDRADKIVALTNALIAEKWKAPVDPAPASIELVALTVAERAFVRKPGRAPLESETVAFDDSSRTQRYAVSPGDYERAGVFLTEDELATLNGSESGSRPSVGSIRLGVAGLARCGW